MDVNGYGRKRKLLATSLPVRLTNAKITSNDASGLQAMSSNTKNGQLYVNGKEQQHFPGMQYDNIVTTDGTGINKRTLDQMKISEADRHMYSNTQYLFPSNRGK